MAAIVVGWGLAETHASTYLYPSSSPNPCTTTTITSITATTTYKGVQFLTAHISIDKKHLL